MRTLVLQRRKPVTLNVPFYVRRIPFVGKEDKPWDCVQEQDSEEKIRWKRIPRHCQNYPHVDSVRWPRLVANLKN